MPEGPENPHGNGFWAQETPLLNEAKAARTANPAAARAWKISNPAATHPVTGEPPAMWRHVHNTFNADVRRGCLAEPAAARPGHISNRLLCSADPLLQSHVSRSSYKSFSVCKPRDRGIVQGMIRSAPQ